MLFKATTMNSAGAGGRAERGMATPVAVGRRHRQSRSVTVSL